MERIGSFPSARHAEATEEDALDNAMKEKVADLSAYHSLRYSQKKSGLQPKRAATITAMVRTSRTRRCGPW